MTDREIDELIAEIDELARRLNCRFVPDPEKLAAFREAQREQEATRSRYREALRRAWITPGGPA
jgi:hypothetical protein